MIFEVVYALVALLGTAIYVYVGYKRSGEPFSVVKAYDTLIVGGLLSIITSAAALSPAGWNFLSLMAAFWMGLTFKAGVDVGKKAIVAATVPNDESTPKEVEEAPNTSAPEAPSNPESSSLPTVAAVNAESCASATCPTCNKPI